jgi:uncharacterized protein YndB with AHSA1/START domain
MTETIEKLLEETIEIDAPPERVWALVTDVPRMARWSPQVLVSKVKGGEVRLGATFVNLNRDKFLVWPTRGKVVRFEPPTEFAFRIAENTTIWSFSLEPTATGGTRLTQRREAPNGISDVSVRLTKVAFGGQEKFGRTLRAGMRQTLERIKAEAEAA